MQEIGRFSICFCLLLFGCKYSNTKETLVPKVVPIHSEGKVSLFIWKDDRYSFNVVINDSIQYNTFLEGVTSEGHHELIGIVPKGKDLMKIYLKIGEGDTTFNYNLVEVDSLCFGLNAKKNFMVFNEDGGVWFYD